MTDQSVGNRTGTQPLPLRHALGHYFGTDHLTCPCGQTWWGHRTRPTLCPQWKEHIKGLEGRQEERARAIRSHARELGLRVR